VPSEISVERRLAAILAADVVGYSRLMSVDEVGTLRALKAIRRKLTDPAIASHHGRIVKTTGDGILIEFPSVVDAVACAAAIQEGMVARNADVPEDKRIIFRMGINIGDIIVDEADIHGDGVNVAARLEGLAQPGEICISGATHEQVRGKLDVSFEDMGEHSLKNIARPVRVYRITEGNHKAGTSTLVSAERGELSLPDKPSIAVLPFQNMSGDPEQEYFADGVVDDIITALSRVRSFFVIARNSSFTFKGKAVDVKQVGRELGVAYVIDGSVRKAANRVRITAQLIDCSTGGHIWADRFDRELTDIFAVQDEVTTKIVAAMAVALTPDERQCLVRKGTLNLEAYDCLLRAREQWWRLTREGTANAEAMLARAIALDPDLSTAYAWLSYVRVQEHINGWVDDSLRSLKESYELAKKAVTLDDADPDAHNALGCAYLWLRRHELAIAEYERTIALDPNNARAHVEIGWVLHYAGRSAEAVEPINRGMRLDPLYPDVYLHILAQVYFRLGRFEEAVDLLKRRIIRKPDTDISRVLLAASYGYLGRTDDAKSQWAEALTSNPNFSLDQRRRVLPYKDPADFQQIVEGLNNAGLVE